MPSPILPRVNPVAIRGERLADVARETERSIGEISRAVQPLTDAIESGPVPGAIITIHGSWVYAAGLHTLGIPAAVVTIPFNWVGDIMAMGLWCDGQVTASVAANGVAVVAGAVVGPGGLFLGSTAFLATDYLSGPWVMTLTAVTPPPPIPTTLNLSVYLRNVEVTL